MIKKLFSSFFVVTMIFLLSGLSYQKNEITPKMYDLNKSLTYLSFTPSDVPGCIADGWYQGKEGGVKNRTQIRDKQYAKDSDIRFFQRLEFPKRTNFNGAGIEITIRLWQSDNIAKESFKSFEESNRARSASATGYGFSTFTALSLGELVHKYPIESELKSKWPPINASLEVLDGRVSLLVYYERYPKRGKDGWTEYPPISNEDLQITEFVARLALSKAYMAIHDFDNLKKESATIRKVKVDTKRTSDKMLLVPIKSLAKQLNWKYEEKYGVLTINISKNKMIIPAGSRELIMGSRKEKLPLPVILDGKEYWVEKNALLRLIQ